MNNIRYLTATHIGTWAIDKLVPLRPPSPRAEPIMWDFGSAAPPPQALQPVAGEERSRAGIPTLRGSVKGRAGDMLARSASSSGSGASSASRSAWT